MKKLIALFFGILWLTSCAYNAGGNPQESEPPLDSSDESFGANTESPLQPREYLHTDFPQLGLKNQRIYHITWGHFKENTGQSSVIIFSEEQTEDVIFNKVFIAVDIEGEFLTYEVDVFDVHVIQSGDLYAADLDDDGFDEIVYSGEISNNGETISRIYKIKDNQIELMEDLDEWEDIHTSRYGYTYEFLGDKKVKIANQDTGDEWIKDISDSFAFDETGKPVPNGKIYFTSFASRVIPDISSDGTVTLRYFQNVRVLGPDFLGYTVTSLKYNQETKMFEVLDTEFFDDVHYMFNWCV
ncbi:MAG: hypothetical protein HFE77_00005 [Clostridiales bacterium]|nr:hypothetical protein [Clostridiales bacterium]